MVKNSVEFFTISGKRFVEAVKPLCGVLNKEGVLYVKADKTTNTVVLSAFGKEGGFFFESKTIALSEEGEGVGESFEACVGQEAAAHLQKTLADPKITTCKVSLRKPFLSVFTTSCYEKGEVEQVFIDRNIEIPLQSENFQLELEVIDKCKAEFDNGTTIKATGVSIKDAFLVASACAAPPGSKIGSFLEAIFVVVDKGGEMSFVGTDGYMLSEYKRKFKGVIKEMVGQYALGYHLSNFMSKHIDQTQDVEICFMSKYILFRFGGDCQTVMGSILLKYEKPAHEKLMEIEGLSRFAVDKNRLIDILGSIHSVFTDDVQNKRGAIRVRKGVLTFFNPKHPEDFVTGLPVDWKGEFKFEFNTQYLSKILKSFRASDDVNFYVDEDNEERPVVIKSPTDEYISAFCATLR